VIFYRYCRGADCFVLRQDRHDFRISVPYYGRKLAPGPFLLLLASFMKRDSVFIATQGTGRSG
jgi:hypothetical protein